MSMSLRNHQIDAVLRMLRFNCPTTTSVPGADSWKVLIYDAFGKEIISPLLKVGELRELGVTVHMDLESDRQPIFDVPAVYFCEPSRENIQRICQDTAASIYDSYYINFSSALPRTLLEEMASQTLQLKTNHLISQIYDQYLNFLCLENRLFSLRHTNSYASLNNRTNTDEMINSIVDSIVDSLFSVLVTANVVPVIKCHRGNAAEMVAKKLHSRLRDQVLNIRSDLFQADASNQSFATRPVLLLLDRNMDLSTMLAHTWSYQCLVHDLFELKSNRIVFATEEKGKMVRKIYDLDVKDFFWAKNATLPFPQMAEDVDVELTKYRQEVEQITGKFGVANLEDIKADGVTSNANHLKSAISALPKLTERKRTIDMHMNIASALLKIIKARSLDSLIVIEESLSKQTNATILGFIRDEKFIVEDKLRLFLVYYLSMTSKWPVGEFNEFKEALGQAGCDVSALTYVKSLKSIGHMNALSAQQQLQNANSSVTFGSNALTAGADLFGKISSIGKFADNLKDGAFGSSLVDSLISGVRNILPATVSSPITRIVESLMDSSVSTQSASSIQDDEFVTLDPRASPSTSATLKKSKPKTSFSDAYVFCVGGGNYVEYQQLQDFAYRTGKQITYGATELASPNDFLKQLISLHE